MVILLVGPAVYSTARNAAQLIKLALAAMAITVVVMGTRRLFQTFRTGRLQAFWVNFGGLLIGGVLGVVLIVWALLM